MYGIDYCEIYVEAIEQIPNLAKKHLLTAIDGGSLDPVLPTGACPLPRIASATFREKYVFTTVEIQAIKAL